MEKIIQIYLKPEKLLMVLEELAKIENENQRNIARFSQYFEVSLQKIDLTLENNYLELIYYFSDNLGGYTIKGIRDSLEGSLI